MFCLITSSKLSRQQFEFTEVEGDRIESRLSPWIFSTLLVPEVSLGFWQYKHFYHVDTEKQINGIPILYIVTPL